MTDSRFLDSAYYKPGAPDIGQFAWYDSRLVVHGFGPESYDDTRQQQTQRFQLAQGWTGTELGGDADGYPGRVTLRRLDAEPPRKVDLTRWKLTLPTGQEESPTEIKQPALATYKDLNFYPVSDGAQMFRAPVTGVTTSGSGYPRCELREMNLDGTRASWSTKTGHHRLRATMSIEQVPGQKPEAVCAQVHDAADDVAMVRLEGKRLFVESRGIDVGVLDEDYDLGDIFSIVITASTGLIHVAYTSEAGTSRTVVVKGEFSGCYFKAGVYPQANESNGTGEGRVIIYELPPPEHTI